MGSANISAIVTPIVAPGSGSPLQLTSTSQIRSQAARILGSGVANQLATDLDNIRAQFNALYQQAQAAPQISQLLLTDAQGQVIAAFGPLTYNGERYINYLSELHAGNPLGTRNPNQALFNANRDGSVAIGQHGWLDVHDPFEGNAAWIGTQFDTLVISAAVNNGSGLIRLTVTGHDFVTGDSAQVRNMQFYGVPNATGTWVVTVVDGSTVDLQKSVWAGVFAAPNPVPAGITTYTPTIDRVLQISTAVSSGGPNLIKIGTAVAHTYMTGDRVNIPLLPGVPAGVGQFTIKVVDSTHFTLDGSTFSGSLTANGNCLRYFAGILAQQFAIGSSFTDFNLRAFADGTLEIVNAEIILISGSNSIVINPAVPDMVFTSAGGGTITIDASVPDIVVVGNNTITTIANAANPVTGGHGAAISTKDQTTADTGWFGPDYIGLADGFNSSIIAMSTENAAGNDSGVLLVATNYNNTQFTVDAANARGQITDGSVITSFTPTAICVNSPSGLASHAMDVIGDTNTSGVFRVAGTAGVSKSITYVISVTPSSGGINYGSSLTVNTDATAVFGTPAAGQSNGTVVTGVTLNLSSATFLTGISPGTASDTFTGGIITA